MQVSTEDWNYDGKVDEFEFKFTTPGTMKRISLQLFFDLQLKVSLFN